MRGFGCRAQSGGRPSGDQNIESATAQPHRGSNARNSAHGGGGPLLRRHFDAGLFGSGGAPRGRPISEAQSPGALRSHAIRTGSDDEKQAI
jgi:hypothetical protein